MKDPKIQEQGNGHTYGQVHRLSSVLHFVTKDSDNASKNVIALVQPLEEHAASCAHQ